MPPEPAHCPRSSRCNRCGGRAEDVSVRATSPMQSAGNRVVARVGAPAAGAHPRECVNRSKSRELHPGVQSCRVAMSTANAGRGVSRRASGGPELRNGRAGKSGERGIRTLDTVLPVYALSRRAPSTTRPSLQARRPFPDRAVPLRTRSRRGSQGCAIVLVSKDFRRVMRPRHWTRAVPTATSTVSQRAPLAQLDRAADYGSAGREFESLRARSEKPRKPRGFSAS